VESGDLEIRRELIRCHASAQCATVVRVFVSRTWILVSFGRAAPAEPNAAAAEGELGDDPTRGGGCLMGRLLSAGRGPRPRGTSWFSQENEIQREGEGGQGQWAWHGCVNAHAWLALCSHPIHAPSTSRFGGVLPQDGKTMVVPVAAGLSLRRSLDRSDTTYVSFPPSLATFFFASSSSSLYPGSYTAVARTHHMTLGAWHFVTCHLPAPPTAQYFSNGRRKG
jgi:hypothetical protein